MRVLKAIWITFIRKNTFRHSKKKKVFVIPDVTKSPFKQHDEARESHAAIAGIISHRRKVYGTLTVHLSSQKNPSKEDVALIRELTGDIGHALYKFKLQEDEKESEKKIRISEERYQSLIDNMNSGVAVYEAVNNGMDFKFVAFNKAACKIDGLKKSDVIGSLVTKSFPGVKEFGLLQVFQRVWRTGKSEHFPITFYQDQRIKGWRENFVYKLSNGEIVSIYSDVTKQKQAEQELAESERQLRSITRTVKDAIFSKDKDLKYDFVNPAAIKMIGKKEEDILGKTAGQVFNKIDAEKINKVDQKNLRGHSVDVVREMELKEKKIWLQTKQVPVFDKRKEVVGICGVVRDITREKVAEQEIRESERRHRTLIEKANDGIVILQDEKVVFANPKVKDIIGYNLSKVVGQPLVDFVHPAEKEKLLSRYKRRLSGEHVPHRYESILRDREGNDVYIEVNASIIQYNNKPADFVILRDITRRKIAEQKLWQSEKRFRDVAENAEEWIWETDAKGLYTYCSPVVKRILGYSPKEIVGKKHFYDFFEPKTREVMKENVFRTFAEKKAFKDFENENVRKDGRIVTLLTTGVPVVDEDGVLVGYRGADTDISEKKKIEKAKSEFVSIASHQLRTPLTAIGWISDLLLDEKSLGGLSEKQKEFLKDIHDSNRRMIGLVNALLNVSRIEMGTLVVEPKMMDLKKLTNEVLGDFQTDIRLKNISFKTQFDSKLKRVRVDEDLFSILIQNLVSNAIKYSNPGGEVVLKITQTKSGPKIRVKDYGIGIPKEQQENVFMKMFRADNAQKGEIQGTGLGLFIVKYILELAGGDVGFTSEEGKGSEFWFSIPQSGMKKIKGTKPAVTGMPLGLL